MIDNSSNNIAVDEKSRLHESDWLPLTTVILITLAIFSRSCFYPFMTNWDDSVYVTSITQHLTLSFKNIYYWFSGSHFCNYIPLTMLSYMFDYNVWGLNSFGYHLQNLFWHILAIMAIYKCFRFFNLKPWIVFFPVLFWAIHPQKVESVVWISERKDVLCAACYFWSIYFYISLRKNESKLARMLPFILFLAAMLSKSMACSLPFVFIFYELHLHRKIKIRELIVKLWFYLLADLVLVLINVQANWSYCAEQCGAVSPDYVSWWLRLVIVFYNFFWYLGATFYPRDLNFLYPKIAFNNLLTFDLVFGFICLVIILTLAYRQFRKKWKSDLVPLFGCYLVSLAPVYGLFRIGCFDYADRYNYIPSVFIWFAFALVLNYWVSKSDNSAQEKVQEKNRYKQFLLIILVFYAAFLAFSCYYYSLLWKHQRILFFSSYEKTPPSSMLLWILGNYELKNGDVHNVFKIAGKLSENSSCGLKNFIFFNKVRATYLRSAAFYHSGNKAEAIKGFELIQNNSGKNVFNEKSQIDIFTMMLGCYFDLGNSHEAIKYCDKIISLSKKNEFHFYFYTGLRFLILKDYSKAKYYFELAGQLKPNDPQVKENIKKIDNYLKK